MPKLKVANKDPGDGHFIVSIIKSVFRLGAASFLISVPWCGFESIMIAGVMLFIAEILGIVEEVV